jgi:hypothetical protein
VIKEKDPHQLKLPGFLWSSDAVMELIDQRFGIRLASRTVRSYLANWGFTPQVPAKRALERDPEAVKQWLEVSYPKIVRKAKRDGGMILWLDESGFRFECSHGRSYSPRGITPIKEVTGKRFGTNMIAVLANNGHLAWLWRRSMASVAIQLERAVAGFYARRSCSRASSTRSCSSSSSRGCSKHHPERKITTPLPAPRLILASTEATTAGTGARWNPTGTSAVFWAFRSRPLRDGFAPASPSSRACWNVGNRKGCQSRVDNPRVVHRASFQQAASSGGVQPIARPEREPRPFVYGVIAGQPTLPASIVSTLLCGPIGSPDAKPMSWPSTVRADQEPPCSADHRNAGPYSCRPRARVFPTRSPLPVASIGS